MLTQDGVIVLTTSPHISYICIKPKAMKKALLAFTLLFSTLCCNAQGWEWAKGTRGNNSYGRFCSTDGIGNVYAAGETFDACYFKSDTVSDLGYVRIYLVKFDSLGNLVWLKGSTGNNSFGNLASIGMTVDRCGNVYFLGAYDSVVSFDNHTLLNPYVGQYPSIPWKAYLFLAKFDAAGNNLWIKSFGDFPFGTSYPPNGITTDAHGDVFIATSYFKNATLGPYYFPNTDTSGNTVDILVSKLDSSGNILWGKQFGSTRDDIASNIAVTMSDSVYLTGTFYDTALIMGTETLSDTGAYGTTFIAKLDTGGNAIWARATKGANDHLYTTGLAVNSSSEAFIAGWYTNKGLTLDPYILPDAFYRHGYVAKYDPQGNILWVKELLGYEPRTEGITLDPCGNIWVLGHLDRDYVIGNDTLDGHIVTPPTDNKNPVFIAGWTSAGTFIDDTVLASGGRSSYVISATSDPTGHVYIIGNNDLDSLYVANDTLFGTQTTTNIFIARYNPGLGCHSNLSLDCYVNHIGSSFVEFDEIDIYPNPATNTLTIQCNSINKATASIYDITGRLMGSYPLTGSTTTISVQNLPPGIYQCRINDDKHDVLTKKVVVMH